MLRDDTSQIKPKIITITYTKTQVSTKSQSEPYKVIWSTKIISILAFNLLRQYTKLVQWRQVITNYETREVTYIYMEKKNCKLKIIFDYAFLRPKTFFPASKCCRFSSSTPQAETATSFATHHFLQIPIAQIKTTKFKTKSSIFNSIKMMSSIFQLRQYS